MRKAKIIKNGNVNLEPIKIDDLNNDSLKTGTPKPFFASPDSGHFCYGCNEFFHDSNPHVVSHKGCKGNKSLGICVDSKEFGEYHPINLEDKTKWELIEIIQKLSKK